MLFALTRGVLTEEAFLVGAFPDGTFLDDAFLDGAFPEWKFPAASSHPNDEETYRFFSPGMTQPATMATLGRAVRRNLILLGSLSSVLMLES